MKKKFYASNFGNDEKYRVDEFKDIRVNISYNDQLTIKKFIKQEGLFYNNVINTLSPYIRTTRNDVLDTLSKHKDLILRIAKNKNNMKEIKLDEYTERQLRIIGISLSEGNIIPEMKKRILNEIIDYTISIISQIDKTSVNDEIHYSKPIQMLHPVDLSIKNSLQINKNSLELYYNNNNTEVTIPYIKTPIIVPENLVKNKFWNDFLIKYNIDKNGEYWSISTFKIKEQFILNQSAITKRR